MKFWRLVGFAIDRILPYSNQQYSSTFGGPILRNRIHFFGLVRS